MVSLKDVGRLRLFNHFLSVIVVVLAIYIFSWPFMPQIQWKLKHIAKQPSPAQLTKDTQQNAKTVKQIPGANTLFIPRINSSLVVNEGPDASVLAKGIWRRPKTSTPDKGGNTVIVGHRFTYNGNTTFYHLDKVQVGDPVIVYWQGKEYDYSVEKTVVVPASEVSVEDNTTSSQLTLYTCTPLWNPVNRLVVIANLTNRSSD